MGGISRRQIVPAGDVHPPEERLNILGPDALDLVLRRHHLPVDERGRQNIRKAVVGGLLVPDVVLVPRAASAHDVKGSLVGLQLHPLDLAR